MRVQRRTSKVGDPRAILGQEVALRLKSSLPPNE